MVAGVADHPLTDRADLMEMPKVRVIVQALPAAVPSQVPLRGAVQHLPFVLLSDQIHRVAIENGCSAAVHALQQDLRSAWCHIRMDLQCFQGTSSASRKGLRGPIFRNHS